MEPDKTPNADTSAENETKSAEPEAQAPADALSRTPEDLEQEQAASESAAASDQPTEKKLSPIKQFLRKANVYFLGFILLLIIAGVIAIVTYLNSQKAPTTPDIASQQLSEEALQQLSNTDASVGSNSQTLTIQGNAIIAGQTLMRGNLNVAGNFQTGGSIQGPTLSISGKSSLGDTQLSSLQVEQNTAIQGSTTLRDLSVSGTTTLSGAVTASKLTVTQLVLSGNASLQIPNHISFTGPTPSRSITSSVLGSGGSASINGSDTTGTININTGNNPSADVSPVSRSVRHLATIRMSSSARLAPQQARHSTTSTATRAGSASALQTPLLQIRALHSTTS